MDRMKLFNKLILITALVLVLGGCTTQPEVAVLSSQDSSNGSSAKLYTAWWCSHCQHQKDLLGDDWDNIEIIECSEEGERTQKEICKEAGITAYPTWKFSDGEIVKGGLSLEQVEQRLGKK